MSTRSIVLENSGHVLVEPREHRLVPVLTWLHPAYDDGIRLSVADDCGGFEIVRVDRVEHVENINDTIMADLRRSQFVIADFTRHPAGVYCEAGFPLGLGRLVIWTCRKDDFTEKVRFDPRPYNHRQNCANGLQLGSGRC